MPTYDASTAQVHVFTFKEGMLSAVAHDLRLRVGRFTLTVDDDTGTMQGTFFADSLRVECAMKSGREDPSALRDGHKRDIEANLMGDVLHARRHPEIALRSARIEGAGDERRIEGTLALHGVQRPIRTTARREGDRWVAEVELHQPDFGIKPYSAMLGTLKVRPTVRVRVCIPA